MHEEIFWTSEDWNHVSRWLSGRDQIQEIVGVGAAIALVTQGFTEVLEGSELEDFSHVGLRGLRTLGDCCSD